ncbi:protein LEG1 homolog isoform X2 [Equus asinus]
MRLMPLAAYPSTVAGEYLESRKKVLTIGDIPKYDTDEDTAIVYVWRMHRASFDAATPKFSDILFYSSETERDFTIDFALAVELCEDTRYGPDFEGSVDFAVGFPHRQLTDQDQYVLTSDFSIREKAHLRTVRLLAKTNEITGVAFLTSWKTVVKSGIGRAGGRLLIKRLLLIPRL